MRNTFIIAVLIIIAIQNQSCLKDKEDQIDINQFWNCYSSQNYDSSKLASKLIGSWKLTVSNAALPAAEKDVIVNLTALGTYTVIENSVIITKGNWKLKITDGSYYELDLDEPSSYLHGRILLCDNQILFNASYIDGADNLFVRANL